jgi:glutamyl-Q tRNA(Asp) synthetase
MTDIITRFAPSPTGYLHLGHAYSAILNFERGDKFLLRIEDIDITRCKPEFETAIYEDLTWLGLNWEQPARRQSDRFGIYEAALKHLYERGLVYRCFKTRKTLEDTMNAPHAPLDYVFRGAPLAVDEEQALLDQGALFAWRLSMDAVAKETGDHTLAHHGDIVLGRKDIGTSYHLSCVMDDADQGVTNIIRGEDLAHIADLHRMLFRLLGHTPPMIEHHKLITDDTGKRFAKRDQSVTLRALRENGMTPAGIRARLFKNAS